MSKNYFFIYNKKFSQQLTENIQSHFFMFQASCTRNDLLMIICLCFAVRMILSKNSPQRPCVFMHCHMYAYGFVKLFFIQLAVFQFTTRQVCLHAYACKLQRSNLNFYVLFLLSCTQCCYTNLQLCALSHRQKSHFTGVK